MKPRFVYPGTYYVSQIYTPTHDGWDIVPLDRPGGNHWPAPIFPILSGQTLSVANSDPARGKGIKVRTFLTQPFIAYLKAQNCVPMSHQGSLYLDCLYWHALFVTDLDGIIHQNEPVAITGNTGRVTAGGLPVPDYMKGVPNYPGLHLHFTTETQYGKVDPEIIFNYEGDNMGQFKTQNYKGELRIVLQADTIENWKEICKTYGVDPTQIDETVT